MVAHPDDETLGVGARITRLRRLTLIHLTDGAPRAQPAIAAQRKRELSAALDVLKTMPERRITYGCPDQEAIAYLPELANALRHDLAGAAIVITHAYEHGHPDHDTAALAVLAKWDSPRDAGAQRECAGAREPASQGGGMNPRSTSVYFLPRATRVPEIRIETLADTDALNARRARRISTRLDSNRHGRATARLAFDRRGDPRRSRRRRSHRAFSARMRAL